MLQEMAWTYPSHSLSQIYHKVYTLPQTMLKLLKKNPLHRPGFPGSNDQKTSKFLPRCISSMGILLSMSPLRPTLLLVTGGTSGAKSWGWEWETPRAYCFKIWNKWRNKDAKPNNHMQQTFRHNGPSSGIVSAGQAAISVYMRTSTSMVLSVTQHLDSMCPLETSRSPMKRQQAKNHDCPHILNPFHSLPIGVIPVLLTREHPLSKPGSKWKWPIYIIYVLWWFVVKILTHQSSYMDNTVCNILPYTELFGPFHLANLQPRPHIPAILMKRIVHASLIAVSLNYDR